jgi:hypothetical protein
MLQIATKIWKKTNCHAMLNCVLRSKSNNMLPITIMDIVHFSVFYLKHDISDIESSTRIVML